MILAANTQRERFIHPNSLIAGTGTGTVSGNYLTCSSAGTFYINFNQTYGSLEFDVYSNDVGPFANFQFFSSSANNFNNSNSYYIQLAKTNNQIKGWRVNNEGGGTSYTSLFVTANSYYTDTTTYTIKVTRTISNVISAYIKGGVFGSNYVLVTAVGNPATDSTYTENNYFVADLNVGDKLGIIKYYPYIL